METKMLYAIVLFRIKDARWQEEITTVLKKCEEFEFTRLIADEGIAVFELIKKLNYDGDKKYFKLVVMLTREQAMRYPKYLMLEKN